jgi:2-isopropylmalate synthase
MKTDDLVLYDTTLRDGAQTPGVTFSLEDKLAIAEKLSDFGLDFIEGGWPSSNPRDMQFFKEVKSFGLKARIAAFGMTSKNPAKDNNIETLLKTEADVLTIFGKSWDLHVKEVLKISLEENLEMIAKTTEFLKSHGYRVFFDLEHFFDGYKSNPDYALKTLNTALASDADAVILCDTNGGFLPFEIEPIVKKVKEIVNKPLGFHGHNDSGMALSNSLTALRNGFTHVQGTVNGLGERCGNLDWCEFLPVAKLKMEVKLKMNLQQLSSLSKYIERMTGFSVAKNKPFVGENAFSHKGGIHIDAVIKNPLAYEHISPELVGNTRNFSMSEQVGRAGIVMSAKRHGYDLDKDHPAVAAAFELVKKRQRLTDAELFLFLAEEVDKKQNSFELIEYETHVTGSGKAKTEVKLKIEKEIFHEIAEGVGPVHAFDLALRKALEKKFYVEKVKLTNFRVRILNQEKATAASVEVYIEFKAEGESWSTTGISDDVIRASEEALIKGYKYYLLKNRG